MPEPSPALIETVARAIHAADGWTDWEETCKFEGQSYRDLARAALAAMPSQPPQDAPYGHDGTEPAPTAPPTLAGPQTATCDRWALDKIRETIGLWTGTYGWAATSPVGDLIRDLRDILDIAKEPR